MRWIVDAMNVIGSRPDGWWRDRHRAMLGLVELLERWAAAGDEQVTVIFEQPPAQPISSPVIEVGHAPHAGPNSGDDEIVRRVTSDPSPATIRVVTSDRALAEQVRAAGASVEAAKEFRQRLDDLGPGVG